MEEKIDTKKQLKISLPIAFENLINVLMTLVDTIVISTIGTKELGAMGAMAVVINIMQLSIQTINVTNSSLIAKAIGEKDNNRIKQISGNSIILTLIMSMITIAAAMILKPIFPTLFNVDEICNLYLGIRLIGFIQNSIVTVLSGQQRTLGKQGNILKLRIIAVIFNLFFDIIVVNLGYGIAGVAWVTVIIDTLMAIYLLIKANSTIIYKFSKDIMLDIFNLFKWNFTERIVSRADNFVFNILVSRIGENEYAVHVILIQIRDIIESFVQGFGDGITISVGIASGRNDNGYMEKVRNVAKTLIKKASIIITIITCGIALIIMNISLKQTELQNIFYKVLPLLLLGVYTITSATYYFSIIRGVRNFKFLAKRNFISSTVKIVIAIILAYTPLGIIGVWISYCIYCILQKYMSKVRYKEEILC